ncbi:MAG: hypothetical protein IJW40_00575 [Clostridia bacterium]|nr:hypothetical protein [Clostridia bacterium]
MLYRYAFRKYWFLVLILIPVYAFVTSIWFDSALFMPYPSVGFSGNIEQFLPLILLIPLAFMLPDRSEIELGMVCGVRTSRMVFTRFIAIAVYTYLTVALMILLFRYTPYIPDEYTQILIPIVVPAHYKLYMLASGAVSLLFFGALLLFLRVLCRNCYIPVGIGLFIHIIFKAMSDDIQEGNRALRYASFDPFISTYILGNEVPRMYSMPHLWTLNRLLFLSLALILFIVTYLLLRRERLHESFGD